MSNVTHLALPFADLWGLFCTLAHITEQSVLFRKNCVDTSNSYANRSHTNSKFSVSMSNSHWIAM